MVEIVASISTQMLHDLVREERVSYGVIQVTDQVMQLVSVVSRIQYLLKNGHNSERVLNHIQTIRYLAYGIEDVLETCAVEVAFMFQKNEERCIKRLLRRYFGVRNDGIALENIRAKISKIEPEIKIFNQVFPDDIMESICRGEEPSLPNLADRIVRWPREVYPHGIEEHFVGRENDLNELISLVAEEQKHRVISVWGDKGLGKTTIAKKVYSHHDVRRCFRALAWISINQESETSIILQDILRQLGPRKVKEITEEQNMINHLKEIQTQKNCLIVLDGISEIDQWKHISSGFQVEGVGTRILLTTRERSIADVGFPYELRLLDEDEGWELLKKHAFRRKNGPEFGMFPKLGKEMVRKCGYLPSAICALGRNLRGKISVGEWQMVNNNFSEYLQKDYRNEADERLFNILDKTYDHLPYFTKQCFLYLGMLRENEDIDAEDLIFLWMAEGMVPSVDQETERTMMDLAEDYLRKLAFGGMLQVQEDEFSVTRRFRTCCLHNRARELSFYQGEKEDFRLKLVDFCDGKQPMLDTSTLSDGTRRLVIHFNKQVNLRADDLVATDHLRSLLFLNSDQIHVDIPFRISDFGKFKLLRVLQFVRCKFEGRKLPKGIDKLVNLRYFGILYCDLDELPPSISNLKNLCALYIRVHGTAQIAIPNVLFHMVLLKHLRLPDYSDCEQTNKLILDDLLELETLVGFNSHIHDISSLSNLKKLRNLVAHAYSNNSLTSIIKFVMFYGAHIRTNLYIENKCNFTSLEGLAILEEVLMCPNLHALTLSMVLIYKFPDCGMHVSSDLTQLKLIGCKIKEDPMEALGKFPTLRKLCLGLGAFVGREMIIHDVGFLNLEYLEFRSLPNLEEWMVKEGAMRKLSALTIRRCPKLEKIPDGLTSISNLKSLEVELAPRALEEGREAEYRLKFAFVNSFNIRKLDPFAASKNNGH